MASMNHRVLWNIALLAGALYMISNGGSMWWLALLLFVDDGK